MKNDNAPAVANASITGEVVTDETSTEITEIAERIGKTWHKAAASIIETGQLLLNAELKFDNEGAGDRYQALVNKLVSDWKMNPSTISKLRGIAKNKLLTQPENIPLLPPSYATLHKLTQAPEDELADAIANGKINPGITLANVVSAIPAFNNKSNSKAAGSNSGTNNSPAAAADGINLSITGDIENIDSKTINELNELIGEIMHTASAKSISFSISGKIEKIDNDCIKDLRELMDEIGNTSGVKLETNL